MNSGRFALRVFVRVAYLLISFLFAQLSDSCLGLLQVPDSDLFDVLANWMSHYRPLSMWWDHALTTVIALRWSRQNWWISVSKVLLFISAHAHFVLTLSKISLSIYRVAFLRWICPKPAKPQMNAALHGARNHRFLVKRRLIIWLNLCITVFAASNSQRTLPSIIAPHRRPFGPDFPFCHSWLFVKHG